jgi:hypothetical protein
LAFVHGQGLQLIDDPGPPLHHSMPMPKQLPQFSGRVVMQKDEK